jgi:hypothetical protein
MAEPLKSAYELAMERLRAKDGGGDASSPELTAGQREKIATARAEAKKELDVLVFLHKGAVEKAAGKGDAETLPRLEADFQRDKARIEERCEERVRAIRGR